MSNSPNLNPQTLANQLNQIKDAIVRQKGVSSHNDSETITRGFDSIIQLLSPWIVDYQTQKDQIEELKKKLEKEGFENLKPLKSHSK